MTFALILKIARALHTIREFAGCYNTQVPHTSIFLADLCIRETAVHSDGFVLRLREDPFRQQRD